MYHTTNHLKQLCGMPQKTVSNWVRNGIVIPAIEGQNGRGNSHKFTLMQAVGIAYARQWQELGCLPPYLALVVDYVSNLSVEEMKRHFERGETVVYSIPGRAIWTDPSKHSQDRETRLTHHKLNLEATYERVLKRSKELAATNGHH